MCLSMKRPPKAISSEAGCYSYKGSWKEEKMELAVVAPTCSPKARQAETGRLESSRLAWGYTVRPRLKAILFLIA